MKKIFTIIAAALMSASMFAQPATVPTVQDLTDAGYDLTSRVICLYFDEQVYYDIVWAGSYNGWSIDNPASMLHFEELEGFEGWYVVEVDDARTPQADQTVSPGDNCCVGKPVQLKKDGSFSWDFQAGDAEAWTNMAQPSTKQHYIYGGNSDEADICWNEYGAYIYEVEYFKNSPYVADNPKHDYTITAYLPEFCDEIAAYADSVRVMGSFDNWTDGVWMQRTVDEDFNDCWTATLNNVEEGTEFKLRFGTDADWAVQVQLDGENLGNEMTGETTDIILQYDGEGYGFSVCGAPVEGDQFVDATSGLKFEVAAVGEANTVMVIANNYTGTSYTVPAKVSYNGVEFTVTEIGAEAFNNCSSLESITIPEGVTTIGGEAFNYCSSLVSVNMPASVTTIGESAFCGCALQSINLPANLTTIEHGAFSDCDLQSITIPAGVTTIGSDAFDSNTGLTSVTFLGNACQNNIGEGAFNSVGSTEFPATLVLPDTWTGSTPDQDGNWYGGHFDYDAPASGPTVDKTGITVNGRKYGFPVRLVKEVK